MRIALLLASAALAAPMAAAAQSHDQHGPAPVVAPPASPAPAPQDHSAHGMPASPLPSRDGPDHSAHAGHDGTPMLGLLGSYAPTRDASGTSWQPDSAPMDGLHTTWGDWTVMTHGFATLAYDDQGGPRGDEKTFVASMLMGMAQRPVGAGTLTLKAMGSLDPLMGRSGYPLLLATGETADGQTELVDRQHPHDLFAELSATYSRPLGKGWNGFVYLGLPGEPALGPTTYMHRFPGMANPEAPISHHWLDSTHVTFGVATIGVASDRLKFEASSFTGREPDQDRYDIERPRMDSWSMRATWNPTSDLSMQVSHGRLVSPEQLHPDENVDRTTASITYNRAFGTDRLWQSTLAWGRNDPDAAGHAGEATDAWSLDGGLQLGRNTVFGRAEIVEKDELFGDHHSGDPLAEDVFTVGKLSVGGYHSVPVAGGSVDLGALVSVFDLPDPIQPRYGEQPTSFMLFARYRIGG